MSPPRPKTARVNYGAGSLRNGANAESHLEIRSSPRLFVGRVQSQLPLALPMDSDSAKPFLHRVV